MTADAASVENQKKSPDLLTGNSDPGPEAELGPVLEVDAGGGVTDEMLLDGYLPL